VQDQKRRYRYHYEILLLKWFNLWPIL
jgi:hypothetical protein